MFQTTAIFTLIFSFFGLGLYIQSGFVPVDLASSRIPNSTDSMSGRLKGCKPLQPRPQSPIILVAHRGDEQKFVENTYDALLSGVRSGADFVETDIRKSKDGVFLIHHDDHTGRVTTCPEGEVAIASATWDYLRGKCFYKDVSSQSRNINTMSELFKLSRSEKAGLVLDVKPDVKVADMQAFADELLTLDPQGKCLKGEDVEGTFSCYRRIIVYVNDYAAQDKLWNMAKGLEKVDPKYRVLANMIFLKIMGNPADALKNPEKYLNHDGLAFHLGSASCETLQTLRAIPGKMMVGWTLETKAELEDAQSIDLDGVVTSRLHDYLEYLKK